MTEIGRAIENGARALLRRQRPDGAFGDNPPASVLGTAGTVAALHAADPDGSADLVAGGLSWLREHQHDDGGWGGVDGAGSEIVATAVAVAALAMTGPGGSADPTSADLASADAITADAITADAATDAATADAATADAITAGRACLARLGGIDAVTDPAIALLCRQLLTMAGLTAEAGRLRRLPLEIVFLDRVRRQRVSFRTAPFIGLALMQAGLLPTGPLRRATLRRARPRALALLRSIYDHEGRTGAFSEDPWPAALVLLGLARAGEAPDMAGAIAGWLRRAVRPDGAWDAVTNLDLTRTGYAATGLIAAGYAADARLALTRDFLHARQQREAFEVLGVPPGGWSYSGATGWPVTLESAEILAALAGYPDRDADPVLRSGLEWLVGRQDKRGSWSLWVRDTKLANDGPCPAITSQAIVALREAGYPASHPAIASAAAWLLTQQRPDGTFENLWYRDYTSGTAVVTGALSLAGLAGHDAIRRSAGWLCDTQLPDGSWGPGDGTAGSVEETAWAVSGLLAVERPGDPGAPGAPGGPGSSNGSSGSGGADTLAAAGRGVAWLVAAAGPDGGWEPTRICNYIRHHMRYANGVITQAVALRALGAYQRASAAPGASEHGAGTPGAASR